MKSIVFSGADLHFINQYDGVSHDQWNATRGPIVLVRSSLRDHYLREQKFRCAYCRMEKKERHGMTWDVEHIIPKATHPQFLYEPKNLAMACKECNLAKKDKEVLVRPRRAIREYPVDKDEFKIVHPHFDKYSDHFEIISVQGRITHRPKDAYKGKETFIVCELIRFSYAFAEWDAFDVAIVEQFSGFIERCPADATKDEICRFMRTLSFTIQADF